ncbi:hypothetical protein Tco_0909691 [Tanacetum coccineum]|uniref:Uncharacterized protein n=1 Tax=Tanacetum coccineum TaxID=301880 RepID=A0ABQ5CU53_9ASTR
MAIPSLRLCMYDTAALLVCFSGGDVYPYQAYDTKLITTEQLSELGYVQELARPLDKDKVEGSKKKGAGSSGSSSSMNDEALARLMVPELAMKKKEQ